MSEEKRTSHHSIDWAGVLSWAGMISAIVLLSTLYSHMNRQMIIADAIAVLVFGIVFFRTEFRQEVPLFPLVLFRQRSYSIAMFCAALSFTVLFVVLILMPFYMDYILHFSAQQIGFVMMAIPLTVFLVSPVSGILFDRIGARFLTTSGLGIAALSLLCICFLTESSSSVDIAWRLALLGCGQALFLSPNSAEVLASVNPDQVGISSGLLATARNLGMLAGVTLAGLLFELLFSNLTGGCALKQFCPGQEKSFMISLTITFAITALLSLTGAILSGLRHTGRDGSRILTR